MFPDQYEQLPQLLHIYEAMNMYILKVFIGDPPPPQRTVF